MGNNIPYGSWDHTFLPATGSVTFPAYTQPKLVLDSETPEGCKAELTWLLVKTVVAVDDDWNIYLSEGNGEKEAKPDSGLK